MSPTLTMPAQWQRDPSDGSTVLEAARLDGGDFGIPSRCSRKNDPSLVRNNALLIRNPVSWSVAAMKLTTEEWRRSSASSLKSECCKSIFGR